MLLTLFPLKVPLILEQKLVILKNHQLFIINTTATSMIESGTTGQTYTLYFDVIDGIIKEINCASHVANIIFNKIYFTKTF